MAHKAPLKYIFYIAATPEKVWEGFRGAAAGFEDCASRKKGLDNEESARMDRGGGSRWHTDTL